MKSFNKLKKEHNKIINDTIKQNKSILIESFIEYYGEEYRTIIEKRFNEISFIYYIDWGSIDLVIKDFIPNVKDKDKYIIFYDFYHSHKTKKSLLDKIFNKKKFTRQLHWNNKSRSY